MLHPDRPVILFYIAHCHSDLTWYLSVDTAKQSANENRVREPSSRVPGKPGRLSVPGNRLSLVKTPTERECAITE